ncbi:MAG: DUF1570 domain-containing protein [Lentisphaeraceae bacterium]|nr:DUF1570 domain-containing protein [Lentisphaeraceae bacterium]
MAEKTKTENIDKKSFKVKLLRRSIILSYFSSLIVLFIVLLAIITNRQPQPFYSWIQNSKLESFGKFVAGLIIEQKVSMQIDAENNPLTEDELKSLDEVIEKTDSEVTKLQVDSLEPRDVRFILANKDLIPIQLGDYLITTNADLENVYSFGKVLDDLYVKFVNEMHGSGISIDRGKRPHICFLKNRAHYVSISQKATRGFHDSLGFFSPVKNCIFLFSRRHSLEGLEVIEKFENAEHKAKSLFKGEYLEDYLVKLDDQRENYLGRLDDETLCTLRHEGTHQLAHMLGIHSLRGFEKRWLTEGIAQYFETAIPGKVRPAKKEKLQKYLESDKLFPWQDLINSDDGSFKKSAHKERQLAYSQSWLLVRHLMHNYKQGFFDYIKAVKNTGALDDSLTEIEILCKNIGISKKELIKKLHLEIKNL